MTRPIAPLLWLLFLATGLLVIPSGVLLWRRATESLPSDELDTMRVVLQQIEREYVEDTDPHRLMRAAIAGMVDSLDNFSEFVTEDEVADFEGRELEGTYQGIGVVIAPGITPVTVQCPIAGGPAERAGLRVGDRILGVGEVDLTGLDARQAVERAEKELRGPADTKIVLRIERDDQPTFLVEVERSQVPEQKVKWVRLLDAKERIGYVYLAGFQRGVSDEIRRAVGELCADAGGKLGGLVLDLRDDPGGLLTEAVGVANLFLKEGEIVRLTRRGTVTETHAAQASRCVWPDLPLVLLVNGGTASASEVVTGALQDHERAKVVGTRTFGKGVVQSIFTFRNRPFRLKITTARYVTPKGRDIDGGSMHGSPHRRDDDTRKGGLQPDVEVRVGEDVAGRLWGRRRDYDVPQGLRTEVAALAEKLGFAPAAEPSPDGDPQLARALALLRSDVKETSGR
ncbi:MAG: S41 family peptidase [Planctomycetota bacterium]